MTCPSCGTENEPGRKFCGECVSLLEHGEWLAADGRAEQARPLLDEARQIFERLEAEAWLERLERTADRPTAASV